MKTFKRHQLNITDTLFKVREPLSQPLKLPAVNFKKAKQKKRISLFATPMFWVLLVVEVIWFAWNIFLFVR